MRILGVLANIQMRVKDLENESIPFPVSSLELIEDEKFYDAMVVQAIFAMEGVLPNQIRHFFETLQKEKQEIQVF